MITALASNATISHVSALVVSLGLILMIYGLSGINRAFQEDSMAAALSRLGILCMTVGVVGWILTSGSGKALRPGIPTPAQIAVAGDLFRDECVRVSGTVVFQDAADLVVEMNRGEYVQRVDVRDPSEVLQAIPPGRVVTLAGRLKVEEGTYAVHFVPDHGSDRGWWRNLRENLEGLF